VRDGSTFAFTGRAKGIIVITANMNCPDCGHPVESDAPHCPKCLARMEPPTLWQKLLRFFQDTDAPRQPIVNIKKTVSITTTDEGGQHEYHSLDEAPPELRKEIEKLEAEGLKEGFRFSSSDGPTTRITTKITGERTVSLFKVKDAEGNERIYHSLEELPPEIRAAFEQAQREQTTE
jgi:hypothetical protein